MRIVAISDTHEQADKLVLPEGDLLIHAGDYTYKGGQEPMEKFLKWFSSQSHTYKCLVNGNHEIGTDTGPLRDIKIDLIQSYMNDKSFYLENSGVEIEGYKIWGSPCTPFFYAWAWNRQRGKDIQAEWAKIPDDTNILITHGPPFGIGDLTNNTYGPPEHVGCEDLSNRIKDLKQLKLHVFGHIHPRYGHYNVGGIQYVNASSCNEKYQPINPPIIIDL